MRIDSYQCINKLEKRGLDAMKCNGAVKCVFLEFDVKVIVNLQMPGLGLGFNQNVVFLLVVLWP